MKINSSYLWAFIIACLIIGWMFSDDIIKNYYGEQNIDTGLEIEKIEEGQFEHAYFIG